MRSPFLHGIGMLMVGTLAACGPTARLEVPVTHPAHPDAAETPVPERSSTLVAGPQVQAVPPLPQPSGAGEHEHHKQHGTKPKEP
jgi:hypothetical protein